jgi:DNA-binding transcriptional regulator YiaG
MEFAYITPEVIKWARKTARYSIEDAAKHLNVSVNIINEWETGYSFPTIN